MNAVAPTPHPGKGQALSGPQVIARLAGLDGWKLWGDGDTLAIDTNNTLSIPLVDWLARSA